MHRLNIELDFQSLFGLHVHSCIHWMRPRNAPPPPHPPLIWAHIRERYWSMQLLTGAEQDGNVNSRVITT
jgi:hypothetical protein